MTATAPAVTGTGRPPYERSTPVLSFTVQGLPKPQGSKSAYVNPKTGKIRMTEAVKELPAWRKVVQEVIRRALADTRPPLDGWPLIGPVAIDLIFTMRKPISAPKTRLTWPVAKPDTDKLARALLDAGTLGGLWGDDSQVIDLHAWKVYPLEAPGALRQPGIAATVYRIGAAPATPAGEQPALELA